MVWGARGRGGGRQGGGEAGACRPVLRVYPGSAGEPWKVSVGVWRAPVDTWGRQMGGAGPGAEMGRRCRVQEGESACWGAGASEPHIPRVTRTKQGPEDVLRKQFLFWGEEL